MPAEEPPPGILPLFLRGSTAEKYGFKTGENVMDLVDHKLLTKEEVEKEIDTLGKMSDFSCAKKEINNAPGDDLLIVVDKESKYGEVFLLCYTEESKQNFLNIALEKQAALEAQQRAEEEARLAAEAAAYARANVVYEDKPVESRPWETETSEATMEEIDLRSFKPFREPISLEIYRPKRNLKMPCRFLDRDSDVAGSLQEFRAVKDPNFIGIKESDIGLQIAPSATTSASQTTYNKSTNKACQYESLQKEEKSSPELTNRVELCLFLEKSAELLEAALQQNETIDIFNDTFKTTADDEGGRSRDENDLREIKNFADPNYSKAKRLHAIDWMPKMQGMVATSAVRNISFDERSALSGQVHTSHILLWDFRQLVRPYLLMQSAQEIYSFQFNRQNPGLVVGGSITGQVVLWDISDYVSASKRQKSADGNDDDDITISPVLPKLISNIDQSHKRPVADIFWLPPNTQINNRGRLVPDEYLDDNSYQFITISGDATIMVWDIRYIEIANDELRHIGRAKNVPTEKSKDGTIKLLWAPIFKAQLKRMDGVGELSLCKVVCTGCLKPTLAQSSNVPGDYRSHILLADEEGDLMSVDVCALPKEVDGGTAGKGKDDEEDGGHAEVARDFIKWMVKDHSRPAVSLRQSPFLPDIVLSVSDWNFHIWKVGQEYPIFVSPKSKSYLSCGVWSPTRPSVIFLACCDGSILVWDFTDSSYKPSIELKATHTNISSIEFLTSAAATTVKNQLLALGTDQGVLHVFEVPPSLSRAVNREESFMQSFVDREMDRINSIDHSNEDELVAEHTGGFTSMAATGVDDSLQGEAEPDGPTGNVELEDLNKEEDAFMKMEHEFLLELGLISEEVTEENK